MGRIKQGNHGLFWGLSPRPRTPVAESMPLKETASLCVQHNSIEEIRVFLVA